MGNTLHTLVVGTPRSGTTLVTSLIGGHPDTIAMSECLFCEENKIVSPAKIVANKLCCPNQVQLNNPPPILFDNDTDQVVNIRPLVNQFFRSGLKRRART